MRYGYNPTLAAFVESSPPRARPILETVVTSAADIKDSYDDFFGADVTTEFTLFESGGIRLSGGGGTVKAQSTARVAGSDITALTPPLSASMGGASVEWGGNWNDEIEIFQATAYLDPDVDTLGADVTDWYAAIFRLDRVTNSAGSNVWHLQYLAGDNVAAGGSAGDVTFTFANGGNVPLSGPPPDIEDAGSPAGLPTEPTTVLFVWALQGTGEVAGNVAWRCDHNNTSVTSGSHTIARWDFARLDAGGSIASLLYTATSTTGVPACSFGGNTGYSAATMTWSSAGAGNDLDLGAAPAAGTDLELIVQGATPSDTSFTAQINDGVAGWTTFYDGDVIGEDNSADPLTSPDDPYANNGADLSSIARQQTYDLRVTLTESTDNSVTPRVFRIGIREVTREVVDGLVEFGGSAWAIDPITCQSEIPTLSLVLHRDGARDYRSWAEDLFASNHLNALTLRVWVGHPTLARQYWLHVDDFLVGAYHPMPHGVRVDCVSPLQYALAYLPVKASNSRDPLEYDNSSLKDTYDDILTGQLGVSARFLGPGITDDTTAVTKVIAEKVAALDVLRELTFLDGSALICSQGRYKVMPLFDARPPEAGAAFEYDDIEVESFDAGFDRRITEYDVAYGWSNGEYAGEREHSASSTVIDNLGPTALGQDDQLDDATALWIQTSTHADVIGERMVTYFVTGLPQMRFTSSTPKPWLEPGDPCTIDQDVFVGRDPRTGDAIRGRGWANAVITQVHDVMGTEFTAWIRSWVDVLPATTAVTRSNEVPLSLRSKYGREWIGSPQGSNISALWNTAKTVRVEASSFINPAGTLTDYVYQTKYLSPSGTTGRSYHSAVWLPPGVTVTQVRFRTYHTNTGDSFVGTFYRLDEDLTTAAATVGTVSTTGVTGAQWCTIGSLTETVDPSYAYKFVVSLTNNTAQNDLRFGFVEVTYTTNKLTAAL